MPRHDLAEHIEAEKQALRGVVNKSLYLIGLRYDASETSTRRLGRKKAPVQEKQADETV